MVKAYRNLTEYLKSEQVTQWQFARRVGCAGPMISLIARGKRQPTLGLAIRIAKEANIPIESLALRGLDEAA